MKTDHTMAVETRKPVVLNRSDWAEHERIPYGRFEGKDIGTDITVIFYATEDIGKGAGTIFSCKDLVTHGVSTLRSLPRNKIIFQFFWAVICPFLTPECHRQENNYGYLRSGSASAVSLV